MHTHTSMDEWYVWVRYGLDTVIVRTIVGIPGYRVVRFEDV